VERPIALTPGGIIVVITVGYNRGYLLQQGVHVDPDLDFEPGDADYDARLGQLQVVGLAVVVRGGQVVCAEGAQQQGKEQVQHLGPGEEASTTATTGEHHSSTQTYW